MTTTDTTEYDRFGPWVDEVHEPHELPRLYRAHPVDLGSTRLVLKIPRNIARRDATPEMDLYDHLLVLDDEQLSVLSRHSGNERKGDAPPAGAPYAVRDIPVRDVVAVASAVNMLDATLTVHSRDGQTVSVRYNGSARQSIDQLVDALRVSFASGALGVAGQALVAAAQSRGSAPELPGSGSVDVALANDFRAGSRLNPGLVAWASHERHRVAPRGNGIAGVARRVQHAWSPMTLHGAVLASDGSSMELFGRHASLVRGNGPVNSSGRLTVALARLDGVGVSRHPRYEHASSVALALGQSSIGVVVPDTSLALEIFTSAQAALTDVTGQAT